MSASFKDLKRSSKSLYDKIREETQKTQSQGRTEDNRFWQPEVDKAGNGYAVIRFLPPPVGEDIPWVRIFSHGFQGPGGWYIENSLTTLNEQDPVAAWNSTLWNRGDEAGKEQARKQKRRLSYISNVYIVKDPAHPENEGKVFLFKFGKKIFDKINDLMYPEFQDETPVNPFELWEGANFKLKIRNVEDYRNYDKSEFDSPGPLLDDDDALEKIWKSEYSLQEFLDKKHFKTYAELQARLNRVMNTTTNTSKASELEEDDLEVKPRQARTADAPKAATASSSGDFSIADFEKLLEDDEVPF